MKIEDNVYGQLITLADEELIRIESTIPTDPTLAIVFLVEITRVYDYLHFGSTDDTKKYRLTFQEINVLKYGWNIATSKLFKSIKHLNGIPAMESTEETRNIAISLLYQLGCTTLLKRTAEMLKAGILNVEKKDKTYNFSMSSEGKNQFLDAMEPKNYEKLASELNDENNLHYKNWNLVDKNDINGIKNRFGNFLARNENDPFSSLKIEDLDSHMSPLLKPWNSGKGIMMAYGSTESLDFHFLAMAAKIMNDWKEEAGLHPSLKIEGISMPDLSMVIMCLTSFNLKHLEFAKLAENNHKEISIPQSLTIWCSLKELINDISEFTNTDVEVVKKVFDAISLKASDAKLLYEHSSLFMPVIIDFENDFVLRPVSSILRNPLNSAKDLLVLRNPKLAPEITKKREDWLREYLYAMFMGTRFHRITGNIKLRIDGKEITDIDAAIYDNVTGDVALFQIKWQDFHLNDVKKLRSKASNLSKELDKWTKKVLEWIEEKGTEQLARNLRLSKQQIIDKSGVFLFGISKDIARVKGYGFELKEKSIAIGTWAQFARNRTEIGPSKRIFEELFNELKRQEDFEIEVTPRPITFKIADLEFHYNDLWCTTND